MKRFVLFVVIVVCMFCFTACGQETDKDLDTDVNYGTLTLEERKDIFASYFNSGDRYSADEVRESLDIINPLAVLTLDEALAVFWQTNGIDSRDYLHKTDENGHVYYQHKVENNEIRVFVNLLYDWTEDGNTDTDSDTEYGFYVIQTNGQNYFISIDGDISPMD